MNSVAMTEDGGEDGGDDGGEDVWVLDRGGHSEEGIDRRKETYPGADLWNVSRCGASRSYG